MDTTDDVNETEGRQSKEDTLTPVLTVTALIERFSDLANEGLFVRIDTTNGIVHFMNEGGDEATLNVLDDDFFFIIILIK